MIEFMFKFALIRRVHFRWPLHQWFSWIEVPVRRREEKQNEEKEKKKISHASLKIDTTVVILNEFTWINCRSAADRMYGSVNRMWPIRVPPHVSNSKFNASSCNIVTSYDDANPMQSAVNEMISNVSWYRTSSQSVHTERIGHAHRPFGALISE